MRGYKLKEMYFKFSIVFVDKEYSGRFHMNYMRRRHQKVTLIFQGNRKEHFY